VFPHGITAGSFRTATTRRKAVRTGSFLALLVVLTLSLGLCSLPAGSATLQRHAATDEQLAGVTTTYKGGDDGEGIDTGDDDRWGNAHVDGGDLESGGSPGDDEENGGAINDERIFLRTHLIAVRFLFGYLVGLL
jgi:hypothetical protein